MGFKILSQSSFWFPSDHFYILLPSKTRTMFWALKKSGKKQSTGVETLNFEFPIDVLQKYSLLAEADVVCHKSNVKQLYFFKTVKRMLYLGSVLLR